MRKSYISEYPVATFFALTFFISWGAILILFGQEAIPATVELQEKIGMAILLGPTITCLLLISVFEGVKGLHNLIARLFNWRANVKWYAIALLTAPLSTLLCVFTLPFFTSNYPPAILTADETSSLLLLGVVGGLTIGLMEELGWTGFAIPRLLQKFSIITTGITVGAIWGLWHFILFWEDDSFSNVHAFLLLLARLFAWLPAYRILMVWVYENSQSLLIVILMHASLVASLATLDPTINGKDLLIYILIRAVVLWTIVGIVAIIRKRTIKKEQPLARGLQ